MNRRLPERFGLAHISQRKGRAAVEAEDSASAPLRLRQRNRQRRRERILEIAVAHFSRKGVEGTRIEEIARDAEVSPGTVYNYFPTKDTLLLEAIARRWSSARLMRDARKAGLPDDPLAALCEFYSVLLDQTEAYLPKNVWRHARAVGLLADLDDGHLWWSEELRLIKEIEDLLAGFKRKGRLSASFDPALVAQIVHSVGFFGWQRFLARDDMSMKALKRMLFAQFAHVLR